MWRPARVAPEGAVYEGVPRGAFRCIMQVGSAASGPAGQHRADAALEFQN